jgi:hypothetical protein
MAAEKETAQLLGELLPGLEQAVKQAAQLSLPEPADYHVSALGVLERPLLVS